MVGKKAQFKYHPRCSGVKLNHLCFADDVILCSRGDFMPVYTMLQGLQHFSEASGLEVNVNKTEMYRSGMSAADNQRLLNAICFKMGNFDPI